CQHGFAFPYSF
nr:immunoglobulin light chain junction region [Macaca mulatta]